MCVVLYGFLNDINNLENLSEAFRICNNLDDLEITFFYSIRNQLSENDTSEITENMIFDKINNKYNFNFNLLEYDYCKYIDYCNMIGLPMITNTHKVYPYRVVSLFDSIKNSLNMVIGEYDFIMISRIDLLKYINNIPLESMFEINEKVYLWRTTPYKRYGDAEDRLFWGDTKIIKRLTSLYDDMINHIYNDFDFYSEKIIGDFLSKSFEKNILFQDGLNMVTIGNWGKYNEDTKNKIITLYENCKNK